MLMMMEQHIPYPLLVSMTNKLLIRTDSSTTPSDMSAILYVDPEP